MNIQLFSPDVTVVKVQETAATSMHNRTSGFLPIESIFRAITRNRNRPLRLSLKSINYTNIGGYLHHSDQRNAPETEIRVAWK